MIIVDASAWIDYLAGVMAEEHRDRILTDHVVCPHLVDFEVGNAMLRRERAGKIGPGAARLTMDTFAGMAFTRERSNADLVKAYDLADNAAYADALYLAMAQRNQCPVMTRDSGMIECAKIHGIEYVDIRPEQVARDTARDTQRARTTRR